jgi:hypothetical protein
VKLENGAFEEADQLSLPFPERAGGVSGPLVD